MHQSCNSLCARISFACSKFLKITLKEKYFSIYYKCLKQWIQIALLLLVVIVTSCGKVIIEHESNRCNYQNACLFDHCLPSLFIVNRNMPRSRVVRPIPVAIPVAVLRTKSTVCPVSMAVIKTPQAWSKMQTTCAWSASPKPSPQRPPFRLLCF